MGYEELLKAFDKAKPVIVKEREKDKSEGKGTSWLVGDSPRFYIRILVEMEKLINETWEDTAGRKAMSKVNGKSLGSLRQKLMMRAGMKMRRRMMTTTVTTREGRGARARR